MSPSGIDLSVLLGPLATSLLQFETTDEYCQYLFEMRLEKSKSLKKRVTQEFVFELVLLKKTRSHIAFFGDMGILVFLTF